MVKIIFFSSLRSVVFLFNIDILSACILFIADNKDRLQWDNSRKLDFNIRVYGFAQVLYLHCGQILRILPYYKLSFFQTNRRGVFKWCVTWKWYLYCWICANRFYFNKNI
jgi:hypothetical protein